MRLLLVRHAETDANVSEILQGHGSNPLSARGLRQAALLGRRLENREIDAVYSSDLQRARQTSLAIVRARQIQISYEASLRERSYGIFEGQHVSKFQAAYESAGLGREEFCPPAGESYRDVEVRSAKFLKGIINEHPHSTVLLVSHSGTNRVLLRTLLGRSFSEAFQIEQENTCLNELIVTADAVSVIVINCIAHLKGELFARLGTGE